MRWIFLLLLGCDASATDRCPDEANHPCAPDGILCRYDFEISCVCENAVWICHGGNPPRDDLSLPQAD